MVIDLRCLAGQTARLNFLSVLLSVEMDILFSPRPIRTEHEDRDLQNLHHHQVLLIIPHPSGFMGVKMNTALRKWLLSRVRLVLEDSSKRSLLLVVVSLRFGSIIKSNQIRPRVQLVKREGKANAVGQLH